MITALSTAAKGDVDTHVRASAIQAIGAVVDCTDVDEVEDDVIEQLREIAIAAAAQAIRDPALRVRQMGCAALEASLQLFFEEEDIAPYIDGITDALSNAGILAVRKRAKKRGK